MTGKEVCFKVVESYSGSRKVSKMSSGDYRLVEKDSSDPGFTFFIMHDALLPTEVALKYLAHVEFEAIFGQGIC